MSRCACAGGARELCDRGGVGHFDVGHAVEITGRRPGRVLGPAGEEEQVPRGGVSSQAVGAVCPAPPAGGGRRLRVPP